MIWFLIQKTPANRHDKFSRQITTANSWRKLPQQILAANSSGKQPRKCLRQTVMAIFQSTLPWQTLAAIATANSCSKFLQQILN